MNAKSFKTKPKRIIEIDLVCAIDFVHKMNTFFNNRYKLYEDIFCPFEAWICLQFCVCLVKLVNTRTNRLQTRATLFAQKSLPSASVSRLVCGQAEWREAPQHLLSNSDGSSLRKYRSQLSNMFSWCLWLSFEMWHKWSKES